MLWHFWINRECAFINIMVILLYYNYPMAGNLDFCQSKDEKEGKWNISLSK